MQYAVGLAVTGSIGIAAYGVAAWHRILEEDFNTDFADPAAVPAPL